MRKRWEVIHVDINRVRLIIDSYVQNRSRKIKKAPNGTFIQWCTSSVVYKFSGPNIQVGEVTCVVGVGRKTRVRANVQAGYCVRASRLAILTPWRSSLSMHL